MQHRTMIFVQFLLLFVLFNCVVSSSGFGSFSVFRPRSVFDFEKSITRKKPTNYGRLGKTYSAVVRRNVTQESVVEVLSKFRRASESGTIHEVKFNVGQNMCLLMMPKRLLGWTNIAFDVNSMLKPGVIDQPANIYGSREDRLAQITFSSFGSGVGLKVQFAVFVENSELILKRRSSSQEPGKLLSTVVDTLESILVGFLERELALKAARSQQFRASKLLTDAAVKARKRQELDRIIHPEKYRTKSATVRRDGAGSGSGRYTPSASTQARRTKSKGG